MSTTERLRYILSLDDLKRVNFVKINNEIFIMLDVHGLTCSYTKRLLHNIIALVKERFKLIIIHGYLHGTNIKSMIMNDFYSPKVISKSGCTFNYGITYIQCKGMEEM